MRFCERRRASAPASDKLSEDGNVVAPKRDSRRDSVSRQGALGVLRSLMTLPRGGRARPSVSSYRSRRLRYRIGGDPARLAHRRRQGAPVQPLGMNLASREQGDEADRHASGEQ
jgi:hypothetical protein